jgi:hypothetical protein
VPGKASGAKLVVIRDVDPASRTTDSIIGMAPRLGHIERHTIGVDPMHFVPVRSSTLAAGSSRSTISQDGSGSICERTDS